MVKVVVEQATEDFPSDVEDDNIPEPTLQELVLVALTAGKVYSSAVLLGWVSHILLDSLSMLPSMSNSQAKV